jgi:signal peptidase II
MLSNASSSFRNPFFCVVAVAALAFIFYMFVKLKEEDTCMIVPLSLVVGGILGNILDRVRLGAVVDFLSVHIQDRVLAWSMLGKAYNIRLSWPAFNVADSAISIAMVILIWCMLTKRDSLE